MAIEIIATAKGATSNSYVTLAEANSYFEGRSDASAWESGPTDDTKNRALVTATNRLEQQDYFGTPTDSDQRLKWPRVGTYDQDGRYHDQDVVPRPVKEATYELALAIIGGDLELADTGLEGFRMVEVGPLSVEPNHGRKSGALPDQVRRILVGLMVAAEDFTVRVGRA